MPDSTTHQSAKLWYAVEMNLEPQAREAVEYALMEAGALGTESSDISDLTSRVTAYFDGPPDREVIRLELLAALQIYSLPSSSVREMNLREVEDQDWLEEWKKGWQPVAVGENLIIAPPWSELSPSESKIVILIEPGMAFGTGTHETTRMCLKAMENHFRGRSFLDVGTGTGILAIAAAKLDSSAIIRACDTDPLAIRIARENAILNSVDGRITFRVGSLEDEDPSADLVCANLTADVIISLLPQLVAATCGRLILSGILANQVAGVIDAIKALGNQSAPEVNLDGEWACIVV